MSNDDHTNEEVGADVLTQKDQERLIALFAEPNRLTLTPDWADELLREVNTVDDGEPQAPLMDGMLVDGTLEPLEFDTVVVDLTAEREARSRMPAAIAAALALFVAGLAIFSFSGGPSLSTAEDVPLIPASQEVMPPTASEVSVPDGTRSVSQAASGETVAVIEREGADETILAVTSDFDDWHESAPVPVVHAVADVSTDTWYVLGGESASLSQLGLTDSSILATELAAFSSSDQGMTWQRIELSVGEPEFTLDASGEQVPDSVQTVISLDFLSIAVLDETVVVAYEKQLAVNWSELASNVGIVEDGTLVFVAGLSANGNDGDLYVLGEGGIELLDADSDTFGFSGAVYRELLLAPVFTRDTPRIQVSVAGGPFAEEAFPSELTGFPNVSVQENQFVLSGASTINQFGASTAAVTSTDGVTWIEPNEPVVISNFIESFITSTSTPAAGIFARQGDWQVSIGQDDDRFVAEQAIGNESPTPVPAPSEESDIQAVFATDFGAAIVWQDVEPLGVVTTVVKDGYTINVSFEQSNFAVTDPDGNVIIERQSLGGVPQGPAFFEHVSGSIYVVDDAGELVVSLSSREITEASLRNAVSTTGEAPERFISWASSPDDWQFFPLEGLDSNVWVFTPTEGGLLATAAEDPTDALFFGWPDEFGG